MTVTHVDFGFTSAREFWHEVVLRARSRFLGHQNRQHAIEVAWAVWHVHEWVWRDMHAGGKTSGADYTAFRDGLLNACTELAWMRDVADAGAHRVPGRADKKGRAGYRHAGARLHIHVDDKDHAFADALERVFGFGGCTTSPPDLYGTYYQMTNTL
jgi:hypothetical protein